MTNRTRYYLELFNEFLIYLVSLSLFFFSDYVPIEYAYVRFYAGFYISWIILVGYIVNIIYIYSKHVYNFVHYIVA